MNPFNPLLTTNEVKTNLNISGSDSEIEGFLFRSYQLLVLLGLPPSMNGQPFSITEETRLSKGQGNHYILLSQPILSLTEVKIKDQVAVPTAFSPTIPINSFQWAKYQQWIDLLDYGCIRNYYCLDLASKLIKTEEIIRVVYTTGLTDNTTDPIVKADLLAVLSYIYNDQGLVFQVNSKMNGRGDIISYQADDTKVQYDNSNNLEPDEYMQNNPMLTMILGKYRSIKKRIF